MSDRWGKISSWSVHSRRTIGTDCPDHELPNMTGQQGEPRRHPEPWQYPPPQGRLLAWEVEVESLESSVTSSIPSDYRVFHEAFSKQAATQLPPHQPWDCAIDLIPGYKFPRVECIRCPSRSARLWRNTSRRLLIRVTSGHPVHQWHQASSSWLKRWGLDAMHWLSISKRP